jgi:purine-binding chemotaxis protein CheW
MRVPAATAPFDERLLTFEVAGELYALPIGGVIEVAEVGEMTCIPTLPTRVGGVMNYHGDALPVLRCSSLFEVDESQLPDPRNVLVVTDRSSDVARLGVPVDRVLGLFDGSTADAVETDPTTKHLSIQGRVANVLDPPQLVAQAREIIEHSLGADS